MNEQNIRQIVEAIEKAVRDATRTEPAASGPAPQANPRGSESCCGEAASSCSSSAPRVIAVCLC